SAAERLGQPGGAVLAPEAGGRVPSRGRGPSGIARVPIVQALEKDIEADGAVPAARDPRYGRAIPGPRVDRGRQPARERGPKVAERPAVLRGDPDGVGIVGVGRLPDEPEAIARPERGEDLLPAVERHPDNFGVQRRSVFRAVVPDPAEVAV